MCILLVQPIQQGYIIGSNRDDQKTRQTDTTVTYDLSLGAHYVKDMVGGGTWLAVHDSGFYAVVLNNTPSCKDMPFQSRGQIPMFCIKTYNGNTNLSLSDIVDSIDFTLYNSCIVVVGIYRDHILSHHVIYRDAVTQSRTMASYTGHIMICAPTLYTADREKLWYTESQHIQSTDTAIMVFMKNHTYNPHIQGCIAKQGTITKSTSIITYNGRDIQYNYYPYDI